MYKYILREVFWLFVYNSVQWGSVYFNVGILKVYPSELLKVCRLLHFNHIKLFEALLNCIFSRMYVFYCHIYLKFNFKPISAINDVISS